MNGLVSWVDARFPLISVWRKHVTEYYVPKNLNFYYVFGSIALVVLLIQLVTGLWLTMFYTPTAAEAFSSIEYIMRDVRYGWLIRYMHTTGASAFFIVIYLHLFRGLLYGSYQKPRELVWLLGMLLFILMFAEAFFGYLLPWGQMSYWGAQVITSLFGAIPYAGDTLVTWLRGDFHVGNATLQRFFALHVIAIPLLMLIFVFLHLVALHKVGSNNPEGVDISQNIDDTGRPLDGIPFHPYYTLKDLVGILVFLVGFFAIVFFVPDMGGYFLESSNFVPADPLITPEQISPLWYMTPFYSMLRAIPDKLFGIMVMGGSVIILLLMPWFDKSPVRSMRYKGVFSKLALLLFIISFLILGYLGTVNVTPTRQYTSRICTAIYFAYFLFMPFYSRYEKYSQAPNRIGV